MRKITQEDFDRAFDETMTHHQRLVKCNKKELGFIAGALGFFEAAIKANVPIVELEKGGASES